MMFSVVNALMLDLLEDVQNLQEHLAASMLGVVPRE